ncbi:hypothetical protein EDD15DRAFT_2197841 [Pisolithus albus]|nr:hypothetical protein EDD15DRAFT_2197841 [Pisolithus albus]
MLLPFFSTHTPSLLLLLLLLFLGFTAIAHVYLKNHGCYIVGVSQKLFFTSIAKKNKLLMVSSKQSRFLWVKTLLREEIGTGAMDHVLDEGNEQIMNQSRQANDKIVTVLAIS